MLGKDNFAQADVKLRRSSELLGIEGSLVKLLEYGGNSGYLRGNRVGEAGGDDELNLGWRSKLEDEWTGKIAAGAA